MKTKLVQHKSKGFLSMLLLFFVSHSVFSQTITRDDIPSIAGTVCPGENKSYTINVAGTSYATCSRLWTATGGVIVGSNTGTSVTVKWTDTPGGTASLKCTLSSCTGVSGKEVSFSNQLILSVKNQAWGSYGTSVNVDYCTKAQVYLTVPRMFVQGTGGIAQPPQVEVAYAWTLPAGWKEVGTGRTGFFGTSTNFVSIQPINCSVPGLVTVFGTLVGAGPFCNSSAPSATATITLNGANPVVTVGPQAGYFGGTACNITPVTFYATTNVALGCISSYSWQYPPSWSFVSESGNSITLRPSGSPSDSNPIKATVNFSCGSSIISGNYFPPYIPPVIAGIDLVCSSSSYSIQNASGVSVTWSSSNTNIATVNSLGSVTKVGNGSVTITATFPCVAPPAQKTIWIGNPMPNGITSLNGSADGTAVCASQYATFILSPNYPDPNSLTYDWEVTNGTLISNGGSSAVVYTPGAGQGIYFHVMPTNSCGTGHWYQTFVTASVIDGQYCFEDIGMFSMYPNPVESSLTIEVNEKYPLQVDEFQIVMIDSYGNIFYKKKLTDRVTVIDRKNLKSGINYISIIDKKGIKINQKRISIN